MHFYAQMRMNFYNFLIINNYEEVISFWLGVQITSLLPFSTNKSSRNPWFRGLFVNKAGSCAGMSDFSFDTGKGLLTSVFNQHAAQPDGQESSRQAQECIEEEGEELGALGHQEVFIHEGGEGRETAAKANRQEEAQFRTGRCSAVKQAVQNADQQAARQIDGQGSQGEAFDNGVIQATGEKMPQYAADEAAQSYQKDGFHGESLMSVGCFLLTRPGNGRLILIRGRQ